MKPSALAALRLMTSSSFGWGLDREFAWARTPENSVGGIRVGHYLNAQVFATSFAERPKHIDVVPLPVFRIAEISVGRW